MNTSTAARPLTDPTTPLLRRTALLPNESLASLVARLPQLNFYADHRLVQTIGRERLAALKIEDDLAQPTRLETFQQLACLTHLSMDELYGASEQRFADWLAPLGQPPQLMPWLTNTTRPQLVVRQAREHLRSRVSTQFCPQCLEAAAYQRLNWLPRAAAMCLEHQCLLLDRCPQCGQPPTVVDLVERRCHRCEAELHHAASVPIRQDPLGLRSQQVIQAWFNVAAPPTEALEACHLPPQSTRVLYRLLHLITQQLLKGQAEWANLPHPLDELAKLRVAAINIRRPLTSDQSYGLYRAAFAGLLDWPAGLAQLLDAYGGHDETRTHPPSRPQRLHRVQYDWLRLDWQDSPLGFAQLAVLDYMLKRGIPLAPSVAEHLKDVPWFIERTDLWTEEQTKRVLDLSSTELRRFYSFGPLANCLAPRHRTQRLRFKRTAVLAVKQRWASGWSLRDVSSWLGVHTSTVLRLVELGLLPIEGVWAGDDNQGLFNRQAVKEFFVQVVTRLEQGPRSWHDLIPLSDAVLDVCDLGVDAAILIQCVLTGLLPAYRRGLEIETLSCLYFIQSMILNLPDRLYAARGWVSGSRFAREYDFSPALIRDWLAAGLIKPTVAFEYYSYFDRQQLEELAAQHGFLAPVERSMRKRRT